jgi:hypothetical protein
MTFIATDQVPTFVRPVIYQQTHPNKAETNTITNDVAAVTDQHPMVTQIISSVEEKYQVNVKDNLESVSITSAGATDQYTFVIRK